MAGMVLTHSTAFLVSIYSWASMEVEILYVVRFIKLINYM